MRAALVVVQHENRRAIGVSQLAERTAPQEACEAWRLGLWAGVHITCNVSGVPGLEEPGERVVRISFGVVLIEESGERWHCGCAGRGRCWRLLYWHWSP